MATKKKVATAKKAAPKTKSAQSPVSRAAEPPSMAYASLLNKLDGERRKRLAATINKLGDRLIPASQLENVYSIRRPTGIVELDVALGGGFPAGGACMISGPYNSGKSWLLWRTVAMQQQIYGNNFMGAFHVAETQLDYEQMLQAGVRIDVPDSLIGQWMQRDRELGLPEWSDERIAQYKRQVGTIHVIDGGTGEHVLQTVLECVKSGVFNLIGVDSVSSLLPQRDADKEMDEETARAARAMMMQKFWEKYVPFVNKGTNLTSLLFTQQIRANDNPYGKDWKITGGKATEHYKLIDVALWPGKQLTRDINGKRYTVGKDTMFETLKGKAGTHDHIKGSFSFYYPEFLPGSVDVHGDLIGYALRQGTLIETNKGIQLLNGVTKEPIEGMDAPSMKALKECLEADFDFELDFRRHVMAAAGIRCLYR